MIQENKNKNEKSISDLVTYKNIVGFLEVMEKNKENLDEKTMYILEKCKNAWEVGDETKAMHYMNAVALIVLPLYDLIFQQHLNAPMYSIFDLSYNGTIGFEMNDLLKTQGGVGMFDLLKSRLVELKIIAPYLFEEYINVKLEEMLSVVSLEFYTVTNEFVEFATKITKCFASVDAEFTNCLLLKSFNSVHQPCMQKHLINMGQNRMNVMMEILKCCSCV
ncbi:MAG: hypothetical protein WBH49_07045 [Flavobacteriaceae bacterium]